MNKRVLPGLFSLGLMLLLLECGSYGVGKFLQYKQRIFVPPSPPDEGARSFEEYMKLRDPDLGWPYEAQFGSWEYDKTGARPTPAFVDPEVHPNCMSVWGDSFTEGGEVKFEEAWANRLSIKLGCRVANFGQGGYGSDQGLLRYEKFGTGPEKVVLLGHMTENIVRNLTRNRDLVAPVLFWAQKPRFTIDESGELKLIPIPTLTKAQAMQLIGLESPQYDLPYETFHPGGPSGAHRFDFPFSVSLVRNFGDHRMTALFQRVAPYVPLYAPDHPLKGTQLIVGIMKRFRAKAKARGQLPLLLIFPMGEDVRVYQRDGKWPHQPLIDALEAEKIPFLDFKDRLLVMSEKQGSANLYMEGGHYNPEVNQAVADYVFEALQKAGNPARPMPKTTTSTPTETAPEAPSDGAKE